MQKERLAGRAGQGSSESDTTHPTDGGGSSSSGCSSRAGACRQTDRRWAGEGGMQAATVQEESGSSGWRMKPNDRSEELEDRRGEGSGRQNVRSDSRKRTGWTGS